MNLKIKIMKVLCAVIIILLIVFGTSCSHPAVSSEITSNKIQVDFLFEKDGVKVYRFCDNGYTHYFTTLGETISTVSHDGGKSYHDENIK